MGQGRIATDPGRGARERDRQEQVEGLWPTEIMWDRIFDHATLDMAERYNMDADQFDRTNALLKERILGFLKENKPELKRLANEFIEVQLSFEAPSTEYVADWAQRALPLFNKFRETVDETTNDMREYLTDDQQVQLDAEMAAFNVAYRMSRNKVVGWSEGYFDPETEWNMDPEKRREKDRLEEIAMRERMDAAKGQVYADAGVTPGGGNSGNAGGGGGRAVARGANGQARPVGDVQGAKKPTDPWEQIVLDYIERYDFTDGQKNAAYRSLRKHAASRDQYVRRNSDTLDSLDAKMKAAENDEQKARVQKLVDKLNEPIERMLRQLKDDLEGIPTRDQRKKAAEKEIAAQKAAEAKQAGDTTARRP
jgi:hypothetical protein